MTEDEIHPPAGAEVISTHAARLVSSAGAEPLEALVDRAKLGDARAFESVYGRTVERIYALCLRMSGSADDATDLVQDVYVRAWEKLTSFRGDSLFTTWLHRLAVNVTLEKRRSTGRRLSHEFADPDLDRYARVAVQAMPGTRVDLERAIAALPAKARHVLVLRDVQGYKYEEIARMTGVSLGTVKAQIHRARGLVKEALER
jgi:RNA polymerase sigma-70 factor (ECF subfamily)